MARSSIPTLLSLDRFSRIMGLNPVHFQGAYADTVFTRQGECSEIWPQYSWQGAYVAGRDDVAQVISDAEDDIARILGYYPAPKWTVEDEQRWYGGYRWNATLKTRWGKVISPGQRALSAIELDAAVVYTDENSDGFFETATIIVSTALLDPKEIKVFTAGKEGSLEWEIRTPRSITISGGTATIVFDSWLLIKPELWEEAPTGYGYQGINITTTDNFVTTVDVYREYTDTDAVSAQFFWFQYDQDTQEVCGRETENSCFDIIDPHLGLIRPVYKASTWECRTPAVGAKLWYLSGEQDQRYLQSQTLDPLSDYWAQTIAWLATARLELPPCVCGPAEQVFKKYQEDRARVDRKQGLMMISLDVVNNPFGTRFGEIRAWERVVKFTADQVWTGGIL